MGRRSAYVGGSRSVSVLGQYVLIDFLAALQVTLATKTLFSYEWTTAGCEPPGTWELLQAASELLGVSF